MSDDAYQSSARLPNDDKVPAVHRTASHDGMRTPIAALAKGYVDYLSVMVEVLVYEFVGMNRQDMPKD